MSHSDFIYLDHCGTTPMAALVKQAMRAVEDADNFGNPSAFHHLAGSRANESVELSRHRIASILGSPFEGTIFTSGATEANNLALQGFALKHRAHKPRLLVGATEHRSVLEAAKHCQAFLGAEVITIPVLRDGTLNMPYLRELLATATNRPTLVAAMHTNNEIPAMHPIEEIAALCQKHGYHFHCDAVQGYVRHPINLAKLGAASMVISPHKVYGPKGIGILALRDGSSDSGLIPLIVGGEQEFEMRAGTPNIALMTGAATALELHEARRAEVVAHMQRCQDRFIDELKLHLSDWHFTVPPQASCAGILNIWFDRQDAQTLLESLPDVCMNRGASCSGGGEKFSHVPAALGLPIEIAANVIRISFGSGVTEEQSVLAAKRIGADLAARPLRSRTHAAN